jgi:hypothetical protein
MPTGHVGCPHWLSFANDNTVRTVCLNTWLKQHTEIAHVNLIWIDAQGAELHIINGAKSVLAITDYVYLEIHDLALMPNPDAPAEFYKDQPSFLAICAALPGWQFLGLYPGDMILFKRES